MVSVCFVTSNEGKAREVARLLAGTGISVRAESLDLVEVQGTSESIAMAKSLEAWRRLREEGKIAEGEYAMVDDVGLGFSMLNGNPGPYIKDFLKTMSLGEIHRLSVLAKNTAATATCTFGLWNGKAEPLVVVGKCAGKIVAPMGETGFGWDPLFAPDGGDGRTFAEMSVESKAELSHRGAACRELIKVLDI